MKHLEVISLRRDECVNPSEKVEWIEAVTFFLSLSRCALKLVSGLCWRPAVTWPLAEQRLVCFAPIPSLQDVRCSFFLTLELKKVWNVLLDLLSS